MSLVGAMRQSFDGALWAAQVQVELEELTVSTGTALNGHGAVEFAHTTMRGVRDYMEDCVRVDTISRAGEELSCFSVFDGHGGDRVSVFCANEIYRVLSNVLEEDQGVSIDDALVRSYTALDEELENDIERQCFPCSASCFRETNLNDYTGSTGVTVVVTSTQITFANLGDSRALLVRQGKIEFATEDHSPQLTNEKARVNAAGGSVIGGKLMSHSQKVGSVGVHFLSVSRAFGDFIYKKRRNLPRDAQEVISVPDVHTVDRSDQDEFLVIASDGLWSVMTNTEVARFVRNRIIDGDITAEKCCEELINECSFVIRGSTDNIALILVKLAKD